MQAFRSLALLALASGCSSFGASTPPVPDNDADASASADAGADANADAGRTRDADSSAPPVCPAGAFCDDFEKTVVGAGWSEPINNKFKGSLTYEPDERSGSRVFRVTMPDATGKVGDDVAAQLLHTVPRKAKVVELTFDVRILAADTGDFLVLDFFTSPPSVFALGYASGRLRVGSHEIGKPYAEVLAGKSFPKDDWRRVRLRIDLSAPVPRAVVHQDDQPAAVIDTELAGLPTTTREDSVRLDFGVYCYPAPTVGRTEIRYDNLVWQVTE